MSHPTEHQPHTDPDKLVGTELGQYRLIQRIGAGASAAIYRAVHTKLNVNYAVKILHPTIASREGMRSRFLQEAQAAGQLRHPNIVFIVDFDIDPTLGPYMVMEFLEGEDLQSVIERRGPLPLPLIHSITGQICQGLQAAHDQGIIHRDLKPENIFLLPPAKNQDMPIVKILDFGLARLMEGGAKLTSAGLIVGTPLYMSPEQCRGNMELTAASDIYSFGVMLFQMLTGSTPFTGDNPQKLIVDHFLVPPPKLGPEFPDALRDLQNQLLAKDPLERPETLERVWEHLSISLLGDDPTQTQEHDQAMLVPEAPFQTPQTPTSNSSYVPPQPTAGRSSTPGQSEPLSIPPLTADSMPALTGFNSDVLGIHQDPAGLPEQHWTQELGSAHEGIAPSQDNVQESTQTSLSLDASMSMQGRPTKPFQPPNADVLVKQNKRSTGPQLPGIATPHSQQSSAHLKQDLESIFSSSLREAPDLDKTDFAQAAIDPSQLYQIQREVTHEAIQHRPVVSIPSPITPNWQAPELQEDEEPVLELRPKPRAARGQAIVTAAPPLSPNDKTAFELKVPKVKSTPPTPSAQADNGLRIHQPRAKNNRLDMTLKDGDMPALELPPQQEGFALPSTLPDQAQSQEVIQLRAQAPQRPIVQRGNSPVRQQRHTPDPKAAARSAIEDYNSKQAAAARRGPITRGGSAPQPQNPLSIGSIVPGSDTASQWEMQQSRNTGRFRSRDHDSFSDLDGFKPRRSKGSRWVLVLVFFILFVVGFVFVDRFYPSWLEPLFSPSTRSAPQSPSTP